MESKEILDHLAKNQAVLTDMHFIYTSGMHGSAYINMRQIAHQSGFLQRLGKGLAQRAAMCLPNLIVGPETLGRTLATYAGAALNGMDAIWCDMVEVSQGQKEAVFSEKMNFKRLVVGKRTLIVDDLLTTGSSISLTADLVTRCGGEVVGAAAVVRRTPDIGPDQCHVPTLEVLAEVEGFKVFSEAECAEFGPCSRATPVVLRPGHGWKWQELNSDYAGGFTNL